MYPEEEYLMLSGIQHFAFCRRQWALIHIEQQWKDNYQTTSGQLLHKKAHEEGNFEKRGNKLTVRGLRISSAHLGVTGQCDVVEFTAAESGITVAGYDGVWNIIPVEYKNGVPKEEKEDELQLCAQALCLEEMFATDIDKGYLYYGKNRRRQEVIFTKPLREETKKLFCEMHQLFKKGYTPNVKRSKKCQNCSLKEICLPEIQKSRSVSAYIRSYLEEQKEVEP